MAGFEVSESGRFNLIDGGGERLFGIALEERRIDLGRDFAFDLLQDVADTLVRGSEGFRFRQLLKGADGGEAGRISFS